MSKKARRRCIIVKIIEHVLGAGLILACIYATCFIAAIACGALGVL